jgi:hypothetical protein
MDISGVFHLKSLLEHFSNHSSKVCAFFQFSCRYTALYLAANLDNYICCVRIIKGDEQWLVNMHECVCVCVCARARAHVCVHVCVHVCLLV